MKNFFNRDNAFKMILFTAMLIMALYHFFFNGDYASQMTSFLGLLIFILSILDMIISILEKFIDRYDWEIEDIKSYYEYSQSEKVYEIIDDVMSCDKINLYNTLNKYHNIDIDKEILIHHWFMRKYRSDTRKVRRFLLYFYFATITTILVFLFLSHEILPYIKTFNFGDWTILSFVIILFEILIKDEISEGIYSLIDGILTKKQDIFMRNLENNNN